MNKDFKIDEDLFEYIDMTKDIRPATRDFKPGETFYLTIVERQMNIEADPDHYYRLNNKMHRCDDFDILNKTKTNILFAGCSITFGEGIKEKYRWTNRVYQELKNEVPNLGPLHVLGFPGFGIDVVVHNIFKYINMYGTPDVLMVLAPDYFRSTLYYHDESGPQIVPNIRINYRSRKLIDKDESMERLVFLYTRYLTILEIMCKLLNIRLIFSTWDSDTNKVIKKINLDGYFSLIDLQKKFDKNKYYPSLYESLSKQDKEYASDARDGDHPGILVHEYFAQQFLKVYRGESFD